MTAGQRLVRFRRQGAERHAGGDLDGYGDTDLNDLAAFLSLYLQSAQGAPAPCCALFEDTELKEEPDGLCLERRMMVDGKKFAVSSVFPKDAVLTPTDKLLSLIDKEQETERNSF